MKTTDNTYNRLKSLKDKLNSFMSKWIKGNVDYFDNLTQEELLELKTALSDINNILTLKTTLAFSDWLTNFFDLTKDEHHKLINSINNVKPNTNGYDIELNGDRKILTEIKCIVPVNNGSYYGAAQRNSILDDAIKLLNGKQTLSKTEHYFKFIGLIDLGEKTDDAIRKLTAPAVNIRTTNQIRLNRHEVINKLKIFDDNIKLSDLSTEYVYLKKIKINPSNISSEENSKAI